MVTLRAAIFAALFFLPALAAVLPSAAQAQDITLRSRDGAIELSGTLLGFDGEFYRIDTDYGELTVDGTGVRCIGVGCPSLTDFVADLTISGSGTIGDVLLPALIESFALRNGLRAQRETGSETGFSYTLSDGSDGRTLGRFHLRIGTTDSGFADLLDGRADIVMALREIRPEEEEAAQQAGLGNLSRANRSHVLALDALVPVVAHGNPVDMISPADLAGVLAGRITNWQALGGPDAPVTVHLRNAGSGLAQGMADQLLRPSRLDLRAGVVRHASNAALARAVADDPFGIGIASHSELGPARALVLTGNCGFRLRATARNIKTEDYPLTAPMFLYTPARRLPALARDFLAFTRSDAAQPVIRRAGFVDQAPEEIPLDLQGDRLANAIAVARGEDGLRRLRDMTRMLGELRRLSISFRFEPGSIRLDAQSRSNVRRLASALETGRHDNRRLVFVGFSDGQGPHDANLAIAAERAETVRRAVTDAAETADFDRIDISTLAYGEALPMACDDSEWGREANRRVEVWLR